MIFMAKEAVKMSGVSNAADSAKNYWAAVGTGA